MIFLSKSKCQRIQGISRGCTGHTGAASGDSEKTSKKTQLAFIPRSELTVFTVGLDGLIKTPQQETQVSTPIYDVADNK
jgi:hypothetical protein